MKCLAQIDELTERIWTVELTARTAADEVLLTQLVKLFDDRQAGSVIKVEIGADTCVWTADGPDRGDDDG